MEAIIYVIDRDSREIVKIEEGYSSLIWTERYQTCGEFELELPVTSKNYDIYQIGNYIMFSDSTDAMIIETSDIDDQADDPVFKVSGRSLSSLLERRINASKILTLATATITYKGIFGDVVREVMYDEIIQPIMTTRVKAYKADGSYILVNDEVDAPERAFPNFTYENLIPDSLGYEIDKEFNEVKTVLELLEEFSKPYVTGFRVIFDDNMNFVCQTYKGIDRSQDQAENEPIWFNPSMDNISYVNYHEDISEYKNTCLVYTDQAIEQKVLDEVEDGDVNPGYLWIGPNGIEKLPSGLNRFEMSVDARSELNLDNVTDSSDNKLTYAGALKKLQASGKEELLNSDYEYVKLAEGAVDPSVRYTFGVDYNLGDIVSITNDNGVVMDAVIDEVVRSYDQSGYTVTPNFKSFEDYDYGDENDTIS